MRALFLSFILVFIAMSSYAHAKTEVPIEIKIVHAVIAGINDKSYKMISKVDAITINEVRVNRKPAKTYGGLSSYPRDENANLILPVTLEFAQSIHISTSGDVLEIEVKTNLGDFKFKPR